MLTIYLATGNAHKIKEFRTLLSSSGERLKQAIELLSANELGGMPEVQEDTKTFQGNSCKKAMALYGKVPAGAWALADDSGLCVEALKGGPGVDSAYYAGPQGDSAANLTKLVNVMAAVPAESRRAYFTCVLCLVGPGLAPLYFEGRCEGRLQQLPSGGKGFGYDPLFVPNGYQQSFAELGDTVKSEISHRSRAWKALSAHLEKLL